MFNDLEKGTTIKFYSNWNDNYMIGDIVEKKDNGYKVSIKSRIANASSRVVIAYLLL